LEASRRVDFVRGYVRAGALFEVGAASGYFVEAAGAAGFRARGIEPSAETARSATQRGLTVDAGTLEDAAGGGATYDLVCAWHVLEHLPEPRRSLSQCRALMRPGGWLFLELPNIGSVMAARAGARWVHLDPDNHVAHYDVANVRSLLTTEGVELLDVHTVSVRTYTPSRPRWVVDAAYDAQRLHPPIRVHPTCHAFLRVVARTCGTGSA
jgi:2-polyprenyl-3-methyl-5-hydroxy-6-metoxy-1,4-benzoquinol methylase